MSGFAKVEALAARHKGGKAALEGLLAQVHPDQPSLEHISDDRLLALFVSGCVRVVTGEPECAIDNR